MVYRDSVAGLKAQLLREQQASEQLTATLKMVTDTLGRLEKENTELKEENAALKKRLGEDD